MAPAAKQEFIAKTDAVMESEDGAVFHVAAGKTLVVSGDPITKLKGFKDVFVPVADAPHHFKGATTDVAPPAGEVGE